ncbi:MerR family transcriptional regulator [Alkaliphilus serpentinus]|uniref:MerR family transcriptional regulator n=1 Tax=Alkaliphilus serpentinus TaxID=1482731 RepID=A0A833HS06_9FIRM|nr:MerR family transcriptional regulator [Alkaliphilus serpentinus]KAB3532832.1 MerR family transcriptional regulator [Alkaliphilus serpentinus]
MEYTVQKLGKMAGVSSRTLRYYDEIEILKPARINSSGYRIYGETEVQQLQQILFFRELGVSLEAIKAIITDPEFNAIEALRQHHEKLLEKKYQIDVLIANVEKTIESAIGGYKMSDKERFQGFKEKMIEDNERKYGKEVRKKFGDEAMDQSNKHFKNMTKEEYDKMQKLGEDILSTLAEAFKTGNPAGKLAQEVAELHKEWLTMAWGYYNKEAHGGLAQMYVDDERFTAYYDKNQPGTAAFLRDAIHIYTGMKK